MPTLVATSCLLLAVTGCSLYRLVRGPVLSARPSPADVLVDAADHHEALRLDFVVFGDAGTGKADQRRVAQHMAAECASRGGCAFALMLGDNIYPTGVAEGRTSSDFDPDLERRFEAVYDPLETDFWVVPGNHDWLRPGSVDRQVRYTGSSERWRMPSHDYEVPGLPGWLHLYGLATTKLRQGVDDGQVERARAALCGAHGWRMLFGHHPVYTSGLHGDRLGVEPVVETTLLPLIDDCGVQFYFAGHDHHQEHLTTRAFEQVIQGAGGKLRRVRKLEQRPQGVRQLAAASRFGFALVEVTPAELTLRFFGYSDDETYGELHCRHFRRDGFEVQQTRSTSCDDLGRAGLSAARSQARRGLSRQDTDMTSD